MELEDLQTRVGEINRANGWRSTDESTLDEKARVNAQVARLALITTEVAEAIEEIRNGHDVTEEYLSYPPVPPSFAVEFASGSDATESWQGRQVGKPEGVPSELADVVIRCLDAAEVWGIDLAAAIENKLQYNGTRGYRHGGKKV